MVSLLAQVVNFTDLRSCLQRPDPLRYDGENLIILNNAFQKKTQKTPPQAIKTAKNRKRDFFERRKIYEN